MTAHCFDSASEQILGFVGRCCVADRDRPAAFFHRWLRRCSCELPEIHVLGLDDATAALFLSTHHVPSTAAVCEQLRRKLTAPQIRAPRSSAHWNVGGSRRRLGLGSTGRFREDLAESYVLGVFFLLQLPLDTPLLGLCVAPRVPPLGDPKSAPIAPPDPRRRQGPLRRPDHAQS